MVQDDLYDVYRRYLSRFESEFGDLDFDEVVPHKGQLIKKLRYEEYSEKWGEFKKLEDYLREVMTKGATLNDEINKTYRDLAAFVLEIPKDFMVL